MTDTYSLQTKFHIDTLIFIIPFMFHSFPHVTLKNIYIASLLKIYLVYIHIFQYDMQVITLY